MISRERLLKLKHPKSLEWEYFLLRNKKDIISTLEYAAIAGKTECSIQLQKFDVNFDLSEDEMTSFLAVVNDLFQGTGIGCIITWSNHPYRDYQGPFLKFEW